MLACRIHDFHKGTINVVKALRLMHCQDFPGDVVPDTVLFNRHTSKFPSAIVQPLIMQKTWVTERPLGTESTAANKIPACMNNKSYVHFVRRE